MVIEDIKNYIEVRPTLTKLEVTAGFEITCGKRLPRR